MRRFNVRDIEATQQRGGGEREGIEGEEGRLKVEEGYRELINEGAGRRVQAVVC